LTQVKQLPSWFLWALYESARGIKELPGSQSSADIIEYRSIAKTPFAGEDGAIAWCAIAVNAALEANGIPGTRSGLALSFETNKNFIRLKAPVTGCIVTWKRQGGGHVNFYCGDDAKRIQGLGGNQSDAFNIATYLKKGQLTFSGYWWPKGVPVFGSSANIKGKGNAPVKVT
jgi:uncharacterized protein (TIGR02594 family)